MIIYNTIMIVFYTKDKIVLVLMQCTNVDVFCTFQLFPFVEFQLHSRLINKMKVKGMNAVFDLSTQVAIGDTMLVAIAVSLLRT